MGLFGKKKRDHLTLFFESEQYDSGECEEILKQARIISRGDIEAINAVEFAVRDPIKYIRDNAARFYARGIDIENEDFGDEFLAYDLVYIAMVDELIVRGYCAEVGYDCGLSEFAAALGRIRGYEMVGSVIAEVITKLQKDGGVEDWIGSLNTELGGKAFIWKLPINLEICPLAILDPAAYNEIING